MLNRPSRDYIAEVTGETTPSVKSDISGHDFVDDRPAVDRPEDFDIPADPMPDANDDVAAVITIKPLLMLNAASFDGKPVPQREWLARNRIPVGKPVLLSGDGAAGKTTIATQLAKAAVTGTDWLGAVIERRGPVMIVSAEEDADEMHIRLDAVAQHSGLSMADLDGIHLHCIPGQDAVLGQPDRGGIIRETKLFLQLEETVRQIAPVLVILEAAADLFAVDENNRNHARQSVGLLRRLCNLPSRPAVVLLAHPSLNGLATGRGTSGSTGWHNSVRARLYFSKPKGGAEDETDSDDTARILEVKKSNYGPSGETVKVRWDRGVFVMDGAASSLTQIATEAQADEAFLRCLDAASVQGIDASPKDGRNSAWVAFARMPEAKPFKATALQMAMHRLLSAGRIKSETIGPPSRQKAVLVRAERRE